MTSREPSSSKLLRYDVFLSFRGEDTRNGFTSHLHEALQGGGFNEAGRFLARAFQKHEDGILEEKDDKEREAKKERVKQWREALAQAANLSGHHLNNGPEAKDIKTIVGNIRELLRGTDEFQVAKYPVGIDSRVQPIISYLFSGGLNDNEEEALELFSWYTFKNNCPRKNILNCRGRYVLRERCLITVERGKLKMHDLIQEMGKTIISEKSPTQPGRWSRPWNLEAITDVLTNKSGTEEIEALSLHLPSSEKKASFRTKAFVNMKKLRFLRLSNVELAGSFKHFPKELRWLCWHGFPFKDMPEHLLNQPKLVALDLRGSNLRKGWKNSKPLENLKILDLSWSRKLKKSPDFSRLPNLGELDFSYCHSLSKIHPSIGQLKKLKRVNFEYCNKLRYLPAEFCKLKSVKTLCLFSCLALRELPEVGGPSYRNLPSLSGFSNLVNLLVANCRHLRAIPDLPTNLESLCVGECRALETMPDFSQMSNMIELSLGDLPKVTEVPGLGLGKSLNSMVDLHIKGCTNLTAEFRNNILQGWTYCGAGGILLDAIYGIPEWFDFVADGNKVSFDVPQCDGRNFKGLTLCWIPRQFKTENLAFTVVNCTKHTTSRVFRRFWQHNVGNFHQVQLSNDQLKLNLQGGDKIVILIEAFEVERTGVNLVWDKPLKEQRFPGSYDYYFEYESEAVPDWLYGESSPGPSHGASDNHPTNQMTATTDEPKRKRQKV
ncbi:TIR-NBS-LRR-type disease resistance-like protein [Pyrus ussuriensis x Pyrus communis]|uniref:TIR-NBS-LRR-type disease resistance-like protein n=1 Tax=Pyrus ussuriensis x Pyrus communis TaxID=2448454 RepID=A0A5N5H836_9ROSA|nr:TIR-NBS-LRR-type disease resistance-like protein [Pyrus ussuriensis x Pyrus communis]